MCIVSLFCVKNKTKTKKQMFIFYVSLTLYKLFNGCQAENNGVFSDHCYFCKVSASARTVAGEQGVCMCVCVCPHQRTYTKEYLASSTSWLLSVPLFFTR